MKILYIITKSNWGGAQKYVFDLATYMKNMGHDVSVAFGGEGKLAEKLKNKNIKTLKIENLERDISLSKEIKVAKRLFRILKSESFDIVHLNSSKVGALGGILARLARIKKIVFTAHGFPFREERGRLEIFLIKILSWLSIIFSSYTICVSEKDYNDVKNWPLVKKKIKVIWNGIEDIYFTKEEREEEKEGEKIKIVSIGELHKNKGFTFGVQAIKELIKERKDFAWSIYTFGGDEENALREEIKKENLENFIEIIKTKESSEKVLEDFDIYFLPSIKEGLPYVLLEASLATLAIVASDTGGVNEIVENEKTGYLVESKDILGFKNALKSLIENKELRKEYSFFAREKVLNNFSKEKMINSTLGLYYQNKG